MSPRAPWRRLLARLPRGRAGALVALGVLGGATEGLGLMLLVPLLELQAGGGEGHRLGQWLLTAFAWLGLPPTLMGLLAVFLALVALRCAIQYAQTALGSSLRLDLVDRLRDECFGSLLGVQWQWLAAAPRAEQTNLLLTDINRIGVGLNFALTLLAQMITAAVCVTLAVMLDGKLTLLALATGALVFGLLAGQRRQALALGRSLTAANRGLHAEVEQSLAGIRLSRILGAEARHRERFRATLGRLRTEHQRFIQSSGRARAGFQFGAAALLAAYVYAGLALWRIPLAELLVLVVLFARLVPLFVGAQQSLHHCLHALPALEDVERLRATWAANAEPECPAAARREHWPVREAIRLEAVDFCYPGREAPALRELTLCLPARTTTAIVGPSGAGKSTLADVLTGLLEPPRGRLSVDGVAIRGESRIAWRRHVAYVPQEVYLFDDTVRQNLLWAAPRASEAELREALRRAAAEFVFALPQGLDTRVGERGVQLSGGERQRITLARALLARPSLLILDEATSALDTENELRIRRALEGLHGDLTLVLIGHRLATLEHADQVLALDAGRLVAAGGWAEVRARLGAAA